MWSQTETGTPKTVRNQGKAGEMLPYRVRERNKNKPDQTTGVLKNVMQEDQEPCKKNNIHTGTCQYFNATPHP